MTEGFASHPDDRPGGPPTRREAGDASAGEEHATRSNWAMALVVGTVVVIVVLHLTGVVGPAGHQ